MQLKDHFQYRPRLYSVTYEWLPEDVKDTDELDDVDPFVEDDEFDEDFCEGCGESHTPWERSLTTVLVKGDAKRAAELVEIWVMSEAFAKKFKKARAVRTLNITIVGQAQLTPEDLGLPE